MKQSKRLYIHGRPSGHPIHDSYAKEIGCDFEPEDAFIPYLLNHSQSKVLRYLSWVVNACYLTFAKRGYRLIFTESIRVPLLIASRWLFLPSNIIKIALMADETLYFTYTKKYPKLTLWLMKQYFLEMDYLICIGEYQEELAKKILPESHHPKIKRIFNGLSAEKMETLQKNEPNLNQNRWIFIGNINVPFRFYYKGVDLMLESLALLEESIEWTLDIVGDCPIEIQKELLSKVPNQLHTKIKFLGIQNIEKISSNYSLCIHVARGDSYPTSVIEMTAAGIPTIVSEETGTKEIIEKIDASFVLPLSAVHIAQKISEYDNTSKEKKESISIKSKDVASHYTSILARQLFVRVINEMKTY